LQIFTALQKTFPAFLILKSGGAVKILTYRFLARKKTMVFLMGLGRVQNSQ